MMNVELCGMVFIQFPSNTVIGKQTMHVVHELTMIAFSLKCSFFIERNDLVFGSINPLVVVS
jgi:hypothetical protein